jgi:hypothetical protein
MAGLMRFLSLNLIILGLLGFVLAGCGPRDEPSIRDAEESPSSSQVGLPTANIGDGLSQPLCPEPQPPLITDLETRKPPSMAEPVPRSPFRDPIFGTCLVRVTDRTMDLAADDPSRGMKNEYSRVQSFNADGSLVLVRSIEAEWYIYDTLTLLPLGRLPPATEPRWDAQDPQLVYDCDETRLMAYNVETGERTLIRDFTNDLPGQSLAAVWTHYEGRPSMDSRFWGLVAEDGDWTPVAFLVYDRLGDQVTVRDMRGVPGIEDDVDHVTISPLGTYFLASFDRACEHAQLGDDAHPCGLMVYNRDLSNGRSLLRIIGHYDTALDAQGREVIIYQDIDTDHISMLDLEGGAVTPLWPIDYTYTPIGLHFSGLAYDRPGWALVSTHSGGYPDAFTWMDDQVFAVELKPSGRVVRLAHTHSMVDEDQDHDYWAEPHASVNRDFTRVLFTSNWGRSGTEEVEMYLIELPVDWAGTGP